jgi:hypothetical protein
MYTMISSCDRTKTGAPQHPRPTHGDNSPRVEARRTQPAPCNKRQGSGGDLDLLRIAHPATSFINVHLFPALYVITYHRRGTPPSQVGLCQLLDGAARGRRRRLLHLRRSRTGAGAPRTLLPTQHVTYAEYCSHGIYSHHYQQNQYQQLQKKL